MCLFFLAEGDSSSFCSKTQTSIQKSAKSFCLKDFPLEASKMPKTKRKRMSLTEKLNIKAYLDSMPPRFEEESDENDQRLSKTYSRKRTLKQPKKNTKKAANLSPTNMKEIDLPPEAGDIERTTIESEKSSLTTSFGTLPYCPKMYNSTSPIPTTENTEETPSLDFMKVEENSGGQLSYENKEISVPKTVDEICTVSSSDDSLKYECSADVQGEQVLETSSHEVGAEVTDDQLHTSSGEENFISLTQVATEGDDCGIELTLPFDYQVELPYNFEVAYLFPEEEPDKNNENNME